MTQLYDVSAAIAAEVATGPDMTKAVSGGGELPPKGTAKLRFVEYLETGKQEKTIKGVKKTIDEVQLVFELSGKNYPPREFDNKKVPIRIVTKFTKSLNEKANFFKLFTVMNYQGKATHIAQLLGQAFLGEVDHYKSENMTSAMAVINGIKPPRVFNPQTEQDEVVSVDAAISPLKVFFWNTPTKPMWDSLFIDGEYAAEEAKDGKPARPAKSKNVIQNRIRGAVNFPGSPIETLLKTNGLDFSKLAGDSDDDGAADDVTAPADVSKKSDTDVLSGIVGA